MDNTVPVPPRAIAAILGSWLAGLFAASLIGRQESSVLAPLIALGLALVWPILYFLFWGRTIPINRDPPLRMLMIGGVVVFSGTSLFVSPQLYLSLGYWILNLVGFYIAISFSSRLTAKEYAQGLRIYVLLVLPMLIGLALYDYSPGVRLGEFKGALNPNSIALVAVSAAVSACIFSNRLVRYGLMAPSLTIIYLTGSRASAVAVLAAWLIIYISIQRERGMIRLVLATVGLGGILTVAVMAIPDVAQHLDQYFALNDPQRGLGSGATGRVQTWKETWQLALDHPLTGVGLRAHEQLLKTNTSAHNGYLATLAEIGFIGFSCIMALVITGVANLVRIQDDVRWRRVQSVLLGLALGYMILALFERYLINLGNPTSLLFLLAILFPQFTSHSFESNRTVTTRRQRNSETSKTAPWRVLRRA